MRNLDFEVLDCEECRRPIEAGRGMSRCLECRGVGRLKRAAVVLRLIEETRRACGGRFAFWYLRELIQSIAFYGGNADTETVVCREIMRRLENGDQCLAVIVDQYTHAKGAK